MPHQADYRPLGGTSRRYALKSDPSVTISKRAYQALSTRPSNTSLYSRSVAKFASKHAISKKQARSDPSFRASYQELKKAQKELQKVSSDRTMAKKEGRIAEYLKKDARVRYLRRRGGRLAELMEDLGLRSIDDQAYPVGES